MSKYVASSSETRCAEPSRPREGDPARAAPPRFRRCMRLDLVLVPRHHRPLNEGEMNTPAWNALDPGLRSPAVLGFRATNTPMSMTSVCLSAAPRSGAFHEPDLLPERARGGRDPIAEFGLDASRLRCILPAVTLLDGFYRHRGASLVWDDVGITCTTPDDHVARHVDWTSVDGVRQIGVHPVSFRSSSATTSRQPTRSPVLFSIAVASDADANPLRLLIGWRAKPQPGSVWGWRSRRG